jgi:threonyl-tRNA synthetase
MMIHRALLGAIERFFAILIEHYKGNLPVWLASTQAIILPVSDAQIEYAEKVCEELLTHGIRTEIDHSSATVSYKIREAENQKIPYMLICGKSEAKDGKISVRKHGVGNLGLVKIEEFIKNIKAEQDQKS